MHGLVKCHKWFGFLGSLHEENKASQDLCRVGTSPPNTSTPPPQERPLFQGETTREVDFCGVHSKGLQCQEGVSEETRETLEIGSGPESEEFSPLVK